MLGTTLEKHFVNEVAPQLQLFRWKDNKTAMCRCPYCGDSKKNKLKTRGYFFVNSKTNGYYYKCYNCGIVSSLYDFLEKYNPQLHTQMKYEWIKAKRFEESFSQPEIKTPDEPVKKPNTLPYTVDIIKKNYDSISQLPIDHPARVYLEQTRKLPVASLRRIYYCENFSELATELDPAKDLSPGVPRILFPMYTRDGILFGVSARCIGKESDLRYITIKKPEYSEHLKVYGLERFNPDEEGFCVEGALDSEFLPNCIALTGASKGLPYNNLTMIFDNEPRNAEIVKFMRNTLNQSTKTKVCIWGADFCFKDINEAIQGGWTQEQILDHIRKNSYSGLQGLLKLNNWKV